MHCIWWVDLNALNSSVVENLYAERNSESIPSSMSRVWNLFQIHQNCNVLQWDYKWFAAMKYFSVAHSNSWGCVKTNVHNSLARSKTKVFAFQKQLLTLDIYGACWGQVWRHSDWILYRQMRNYPNWYQILKKHTFYGHLNVNWPSTQKIQEEIKIEKVSGNGVKRERKICFFFTQPDKIIKKIINMVQWQHTDNLFFLYFSLCMMLFSIYCIFELQAILHVV